MTLSRNKTCYKCNIEKLDHEFSKYSFFCKRCIVIIRRSSKEAVIKDMYKSLLKSVVGKSPDFTLEDFTEVISNHYLFDWYYSQWQHSNRKLKLKPYSRFIDEDKPLTLDNIQLTVKELCKYKTSLYAEPLVSKVEKPSNLKDIIHQVYYLIMKYFGRENRNAK